MRERIAQSDEEQDYTKLIGQRIRFAAATAGLSQTDIGDKLGVSFQQVQKYVNGSNRISSYRLFKIATMTGKDITYFFHGDSDENAVSDASNQRKKVLLMRKYNALSLPAQNVILKLVTLMEHDDVE